MDKSTGLHTYYTHRSCSALQTYAAKLPAHTFCADVNVRGALESVIESTEHWRHLSPCAPLSAPRLKID